MKKLSVLLSFFLFTLSALLVSCQQAKSVATKESKPNIVFILADDLGIGDLGSYGQRKIQTPNIDHMASEGMLFTQFYAGSTVCAPSRASLMTGQHTGHTYIRGNGEYPLQEQDVIIPELLQKAGYTTAMFGKWGLGLENTAGAPQKKGWDHFLGHLHHISGHFQQPDSVFQLENGQLQKTALPEGAYVNEVFTSKTLDFMKQQAQQEKPFFLYLSFTIPHAELVVPNKYKELYLNENGSSKFAPEVAQPDGKWYGPQPHPRAAYAGLVTSMDDYVGQVLKKLKELGLEENTLVVFASDNGTHVEGGRRAKDVNFFESSGPYRGVKRDLYEGGIRMPFIAYWPGRIEAGTENHFLGAFWDVMPTFLELAGVAELPQNIDGVSFASTLFGQEAEKKHDYLYWEFYEGGGKQAVRKDNWKAVRLNVNKNPDAAIELYNLAKDPGEQNNLAGAHPEIVAEMRSIMEEAHTESPIFSFKD
jgi:arylsulfatase A-like enzyme